MTITEKVTCELCGSEYDYPAHREVDTHDYQISGVWISVSACRHHDHKEFRAEAEAQVAAYLQETEPNLILRLRTTVGAGWYDDTPQEAMIQQLERALHFAKMNLSMREQYQVREDLEAVRNYREAS